MKPLRPLAPLCLATALAALLAGCTPTVGPTVGPTVAPAPPAPAPPAPATGPGSPLIIRNDDGGNVTAYVLRRGQLERAGRPVEFHGYCASACTLLITLPNACLARDATVGFHMPHFIASGAPAPMLNPLMAQYYRGGILARWNAEWSKSTTMQVISAQDYVRLDPQTKLCR